MATPTLSLRGLHKSFGATRALAGVDLDLEAGEIHALVGENGAGKSTLMNVIAGGLTPDRGTIDLGGQSVVFHSAAEARAAGVALIHQELSLFPHLSVAENILMGRERARAGWLRRRENRTRVEEILARFSHPAIHPERRSGDLPIAAQQVVEICRALVGSPRVLLMDEPTSSLERRDVDRLFALVRDLATTGIAVVYISHFLEEVRALCGSYTILRDGASVGAGRLTDVTDQEIVTRMVGRTIEDLFPPRGRTHLGDILLDVKNLTAPGVERASVEVRAGEVVGIAGVVGSGRTELLRAIAGLADGGASGAVTVKGRVLHPGDAPVRRIRSGLGYLSEDRKREGLALPLSIADNLTLSDLASVSRRGFIDPGKQRAAAEREITRLGVRAADGRQRVGALSGGNQQKVALGRLFHQDADVLLLDEPTRGVDIGSKVQLYEAIAERARAGKAVLLVSSYLPELFGLCDRLAVMCRGVLSQARPVADWSPESVMEMATGGKAAA